LVENKYQKALDIPSSYFGIIETKLICNSTFLSIGGNSNKNSPVFPI